MSEEARESRLSSLMFAIERKSSISIRVSSDRKMGTPLIVQFEVLDDQMMSCFEMAWSGGSVLIQNVRDRNVFRSLNFFVKVFFFVKAVAMCASECKH